MEVDGPFKVLKYINDKVYKVKFLEDYGVPATSNVGDLSPSHED